MTVTSAGWRMHCPNCRAWGRATTAYCDECGHRAKTRFVIHADPQRVYATILQHFGRLEVPVAEHLSDPRAGANSLNISTSAEAREEMLHYLHDRRLRFDATPIHPGGTELPAIERVEPVVPRRRGLVSVVLAVVTLAAIGFAGLFAYQKFQPRSGLERGALAVALPADAGVEPDAGEGATAAATLPDGVWARPEIESVATQRAQRASVRIEGSGGIGAGVLVDRGWVVTARSLLGDGGAPARVRLFDGTWAVGEPVYEDASVDLVALRLPSEVDEQTGADAAELGRGAQLLDVFPIFVADPEDPDGALTGYVKAINVVAGGEHWIELDFELPKRLAGAGLFDESGRLVGLANHAASEALARLGSQPTADSLEPAPGDATLAHAQYAERLIQGPKALLVKIYGEQETDAEYELIIEVTEVDEADDMLSGSLPDFIYLTSVRRTYVSARRRCTGRARNACNHQFHLAAFQLSTPKTHAPMDRADVIFSNGRSAPADVMGCTRPETVSNRWVKILARLRREIPEIDLWICAFRVDGSHVADALALGGSDYVRLRAWGHLSPPIGLGLWR